LLRGHPSGSLDSRRQSPRSEGRQGAAGADRLGATLLALALRLVEVGSNLHGDEVRAYRVVSGSIGTVFDLLVGEHATEVTPPLYFLLAWASAHLGDSLNWIRLPSIVFGTATVPVVYALARRVKDDVAAAVAALLVALSPFAIFYATEGRAYATMAFLVTVSTLALLKALEDGAGRWWIVYAACGCAALYTHYTAVFVIATQALWSLAAFPERCGPSASPAPRSWSRTCRGCLSSPSRRGRGSRTSSTARS
jgi:mannosyltransferase